MVPRLFAAAAVTALMLTTASAQSPAPAPSATSDSSAGVGTVTTQTSDQWLASRLIGTVVYNSANERIGTINDLLLDKNGMPIAAIINAGGFLGIGGKKVAVDLKTVQFVRSSDGDRATAHLTKEQLQQAAEFKPYVPPRPEAPVSANRGPSPLGTPGSPR